MSRYMNIENLSNIRVGEGKDVIHATLAKPGGKDFEVEFRPITKNVFQRKLLVLINGHPFDELEPTTDVVNFYFQLCETEWKIRDKAREKERAEIREAMMEES